MWWEEAILAVARAHGWPVVGDSWYVEVGPRYGLFGPRRLVVEVRDGTSGGVRGSFLFDVARRALVATRISPRRFVPLWRLRCWASCLLWLPVRLLLWVPYRCGAWLGPACGRWAERLRQRMESRAEPGAAPDRGGSS
jgi:hypothetical protein